MPGTKTSGVRFHRMSLFFCFTIGSLNHAYDEMIEQRPTNVHHLCHGELPLTARLEPWMTETVERDDLSKVLDQYGSPLNLIATEPMARNIDELNAVAASQNVNFRIYFARKSNKCLSIVKQAIRQGAGIDTASENEIVQCLGVGADPSDLICTAAVKSESLLKLCIDRQVCVAIDNHDELDAIIDLATQRNRMAIVALRLGGFDHEGIKLPTRFGFDATGDLDLTNALDRKTLTVRGIHFHLDGYDASHRVSAIQQSLRWVRLLRSSGFPIEFLDIGGGFPMSYLDDGCQWSEFWLQHDEALLGHRSQITYRNHPLGKQVHNGSVIGTASSYPYHQNPVRAEWLARILTSEFDQQSVASQLRAADVQLRCEPGRSLLDGCGMTIARVEFRKRIADGDWLIGLSMNRTQCRTSSDDFLVDPILVPTTRPSNEAISGYLVGAYCTESELISLRRLHFPWGVHRGDVIVFPNTAGYLMHFLESRSHQFPLAKNVVLTNNGSLELDPIDGG